MPQPRGSSMNDAEQPEPKGRPLALDPNAKSASPTEPAFIARPKGAPVSHGFVVLDDVVIDGFTLGSISDFEAEPMNEGDAFVIAPDGSRAGLVWEVSTASYFQQVCPIEADRWGVWALTFPFPMRTREDARKNLGAVLPQLRAKWEQWK